MTYTKYSLGVATAATGTGTAQDGLKSHYPNATVIVRGTFVGTVAIELSLDGTNFAPFTSVTVPTAIKIDCPFRAIRTNVTAYTSGQAVVDLAIVDAFI